jgi:hypothetical protein
VWYKEPFFQVALPIIITFGMAYWHNNKRLDDLRTDIGKRIDDLRADITRRLDDVTKRLDRLEQRSTVIRP